MQKEYFKIVSFALLLFFNYSIKAQTFEWAKSFGGWSNDGGTSITTDASGNVFTTGYFQYTVDFDPGASTANLTSKGYSDVFVQKLDPSGNLIWVKSFGGTNADVGNSITVDALGNVYTTGYFGDTVDFDPGVGTTSLTSKGYSDVFIQKLDPSGNLLWAKSFGGWSNDGGMSITVDTSGNAYLTGFFRDTVDFDPGAGTTNLTASEYSDVFVQKLDPSGNLLWVKSFGGTRNDASLSIAVDASGNLYTTGFFRDTADFDPGAGTTNLTSMGADDVFVQKLDPLGNFLWAKSFGGTKDDLGTSISVDASGNVYTTGNFRDTVDFDPGAGTTNLTSNWSSNVFVQKLDPSGSLLWAESFGGMSSDGGMSITVDASENAYITGFFRDTVDFDPGVGTTNLASKGASDVFVQKLDPLGNLLWVRSFGGWMRNDGGSSIAVDASGNVYTTGFFGDTVDFDSGAGTTSLVSKGYSDVFMQNMSQSPPLRVIDENFGNELIAYPNPTSGSFSIDLGNENENSQVIITDISGKKIESISKTQTRVLKLSIYEPDGIYLISVRAGTKTAVIKMVKQ